MNAAARWKLPPRALVRFLLVRHGEPEERARDRFCGRFDVALSERGTLQLEETARWLASAPVAAVYSSPLRRAIQSAEILGAPHGLVPRRDRRLAELHFGVLEGLAYEEAERRYPELYRAWMERPTEIEFPGGESFSSMRERVLEAAREIQGRHPGESVALVAHGGVNRALLAEALELPSSSLFRLGQSYASLSVIDYYETTAVVELLNRSLASVA